VSVRAWPPISITTRPKPPAPKTISAANSTGLIPAFGDAHVHPIQGGLESLRCNLVNFRSRQEYLAAIAAYSETLPPSAWVLGGGWSMPAFPGGTPVAADLDAVTGKRCTFMAFPWRFPLGDGCPIRVVAVIDPDQTFRIPAGTE